MQKINEEGKKVQHWNQQMFTEESRNKRTNVEADGFYFKLAAIERRSLSNSLDGCCGKLAREKKRKKRMKERFR